MTSFRPIRNPFKVTGYPKLLLSLAIISVGALLGVILQDDLFGNYLWSLTALVFSTLPLVPIGAIALIKRLWRKEIGQVLGWAIAILFSFILSIFIFLAVGGIINRWKIDAVNSYVARAAPILDKMQTRDGSYPLTLPVSTLGKPPSLLRDYGDYSSDGKEFRFEYVDEPAGWAGGEGALEFDSSDRKWSHNR